MRVKIGLNVSLGFALGSGLVDRGRVSGSVKVKVGVGPASAWVQRCRLRLGSRLVDRGQPTLV